MLVDVSIRAALLAPAALHQACPVADLLGDVEVFVLAELLEDELLVAGALSGVRDGGERADVNLESVGEVRGEVFEAVDARLAFRTRFDRDDEVPRRVDRVVEMGPARRWRVTDEDVVLAGDRGDRVPELAESVVGVAESFSFLLLAVEDAREVFEAVVLGDDVDAFGGLDEVLDWALFAAGNVADEAVYRGVGAVVVDAEQPGEVAVLWVERDDEDVESGSGVRASEVCGKRRLPDAPRPRCRRCTKAYSVIGVRLV